MRKFHHLPLISVLIFSFLSQSVVNKKNEKEIPDTGKMFWIIYKSNLTAITEEPVETICGEYNQLLLPFYSF